MSKWKVLALIVFFSTLIESAFAQGCSQCKLLAEQGAVLDEASFGTNINYGILYLMIIPYLLLMALFHKRIIAFFKRRFAK